MLGQAAAVPVDTIRLGGGGARSKLWQRIQTDIYGHQVELVEADEGAAYGAALLAGVGVGTWTSVDEACGVSVRVRERLEPEASLRSLMDQQYRAYQRVYPAVRSL